MEIVFHDCNFCYLQFWIVLLVSQCVYFVYLYNSFTVVMEERAKVWFFNKMFFNVSLLYGGGGENKLAQEVSSFVF
jgi:hypothetical protein